MNTDTLEQFKADLEHHDWFHYMSDDHSVYLAGERAYGLLKARAEAGGEEFKRAYNAADAKRFNTSAFVWEGHPYTPPYPEVV